MANTMAAQASAILYQNPQRDITVIDVPTSIALALRIPGDFLSAKAPNEPHPDTNAPKSQKAKAKCKTNTVDGVLHANYKSDIESALEEVRKHVKSCWCFPRQVMHQTPKPAGRKTENSGMEVDDPEEALSRQLRKWSEEEEKDDDFATMMAKLSMGVDFDTPNWVMSYAPLGKDGKADQGSGSLPDQQTIEEPLATCFHNPREAPLDITIRDPAFSEQGRSFRFRIPPRSTFFLKDINHAEAFRHEFRTITEEHKLPRHFDFVVLDPPWPNHSARRKAGYAPAVSNKALAEMILKLDLDTYLEHNAIVGIWVTNKQSVRDVVLGKRGIFEKLNVGFIEEWIWVKTTSKGEFISEIDSLWRKPYEVLLLGRAAPDAVTKMQAAEPIKRRTIFGVPDFHSRKPCLKELIEPYMPDTDYTALEVFARHLVAGWSSLGNEVLKYNWEGYWASGSIEDSRLLSP